MTTQRSVIAAVTAVASAWTVWPVHARSQPGSATVWISSPAAALPAAFSNGTSSEPAISADGTVVAFTSASPSQTGLAPGRSSQVFVHDSKRPAGDQIELVSVGVDAQAVNNTSSSQPSVSCDGRFVAFTSDAALDPDDRDNGEADIYVRDRATGRTELASVALPGDVTAPAISADGRYVAMVAARTVQTRLPFAQVYVYDRVEQVMKLVSHPSDGPEGGDGDSLAPAISLDGGVVAFLSAANLDRSPEERGPPASRVFVWRRSDDTVSAVSVSVSGGRPDASCGPPAISQGGKLIAYACLAGNLVPGDANQAGDVFVTDWTARSTSVASATNGQRQANGDSCLPLGPGRCDARVAISPEGRFVAFASAATNLLDAEPALGGLALAQSPEGRRDTNAATDVFVRDFTNRSTSRASVLDDGSQVVDGDSTAPAVAYGARRIAFVSTSPALTGGACHPQTCAPNTFVRSDPAICLPCQSGACPAPPVVPSLSVRAEFVPAGRATTAVGIGFPPSVPVEVTVGGLTSPVTSDGTGSFEAPVLVPHGTMAGSEVVRARSRTRAAKASIFVVRRPQQPPFPSLS